MDFGILRVYQAWSASTTQTCRKDYFLERGQKLGETRDLPQSAYQRYGSPSTKQQPGYSKALMKASKFSGTASCRSPGAVDTSQLAREAQHSWATTCASVVSSSRPAGTH